MPIRFRQVLLLDDFLRTADNGLHLPAANRRFLRGLFGPVFARLGIPAEERFAAREGGNLEVGTLMEALGLPRTVNGWAKATSADLRPAAQVGRLPEIDESTLVIGFGLTPAFLHYVASQGGAFLDVEVDPIRFGANLRLACRTNDRAIQAVLETLRCDSEGPWDEAAARLAHFLRYSPSYAFDPRLRLGVFFGQTACDLALVSDGRICRPEEYASELDALAQTVDLVLLCPHPYEARLDLLEALHRQVPRSAHTRLGIYSLLCAENVAWVAALSSGALKEARHFGKPAHAFILPDRDAPRALPSTCGAWVPVSSAIASRAAVERMCLVGDPADLQRARERAAPDTISRVIGGRWGLEGGFGRLPEAPTLALGERQAVRAGSPTCAWLDCGWSVPEPWGVWTDGGVATLVLPLPASAEASRRDLRITLQGIPYVAPDGRQPAVSGRVAGASLEWRQGEASCELSAVLPAEVWTARRALDIELRVEGYLQPAAFGGSDTRCLGFGLSDVSADIL